MKSKNNIEKIPQELLKKDFSIKLSIQEKAAFKMLGTKKNKKIIE